MSIDTTLLIWLICDADRRTVNQTKSWSDWTHEELKKQYDTWNDNGAIRPAYAEPQPTSCWHCGHDLEKPGGNYTLAACPICNEELVKQLRREATSWYSGGHCKRCTCLLIDTPDLKGTCPRCHYETWPEGDPRWNPDPTGQVFNPDNKVTWPGVGD